MQWNSANFSDQSEPAPVAPALSRPPASQPWLGLTFVEILILFLVTGILAALILPGTAALSEQRDRARCQANIREQLIAMHLFGDDHAGQDPQVPEHLQHLLGNATAGFWWVTSSSADNAPLSLYPEYLHDLSVFICPSTRNRIRETVRDQHGVILDLRTNAPGGREDDRGGHSYEYFGVYGVGFLSGIVKTPETVPGWLRADTVLILDGDDGPTLNNCPEPENNHGSAGWNWGFVDGSVSWVTRAETNDFLSRSFHASPRCPD